MNQQDAAKFLGISTRMLRIYTKQGRIQAAVDTTRSRRTLTYDPDGLRALKAELEQKRLDRLTRPETQSGGHIGFQLDDHYMRRLTEAGAARGLSASGYARTLVVDALESGEQVRLRDDIADLAHRLRLLGEDLATSVVALLMYGGQIEQESEARAWAAERLKAFRQRDLKGA